MNELSLACNCGKVRGSLSDITPRSGTRLVCYCDDCQGFAHALGDGADVLDIYGGTEVIQVTLGQVAITHGQDQLRSLRLKRGGLLRWYAGCCNTPIANTVSAKLPFLGLVRGFIKDDGAEAALGPVLYRIHGRFAHNAPADAGIHPKAPLRLALRVGPKLLAAKLRGDRCPAFFDSEGAPTIQPQIVAPDQQL